MIDATTRLGEARKQIRIAAELLDDDELVEELQKAETIVDTVERESPADRGE